jgi:hypothetical protein
LKAARDEAELLGHSGSVTGRSPDQLDPEQAMEIELEDVVLGSLGPILTGRHRLGHSLLPLARTHP